MSAATIAPVPSSRRSIGEVLLRYLLGGALGAAVVLFVNTYGLGLQKRAFDASQETRLHSVEQRLDKLEPDAVRRQEMNDLKQSVVDLRGDVREVNRQLGDMNNRMIDNGYLRRR